MEGDILHFVDKRAGGQYLHSKSASLPLAAVQVYIHGIYEIAIATVGRTPQIDRDRVITGGALWHLLGEGRRHRCRITNARPELHFSVWQVYVGDLQSYSGEKRTRI